MWGLERGVRGSWGLCPGSWAEEWEPVPAPTVRRQCSPSKTHYPPDEIQTETLPLHWQHFTLDVGNIIIQSVALGNLVLNFIFHVQFQIIQNIENGLFQRHIK